MLWYKLTMPCESWLTVVIRASPIGHDQSVFHQVLTLFVSDEL